MLSVGLVALSGLTARLMNPLQLNFGMNGTVMGLTVSYDIQIMLNIIAVVMMILLSPIITPRPIASYRGRVWKFPFDDGSKRGVSCPSLLTVFLIYSLSISWVFPSLGVILACFGFYLWSGAAFLIGLSFLRDHFWILTAAALFFARPNSLAQNTDSTYAKFFTTIFYKFRQGFFYQTPTAFFKHFTSNKRAPWRCLPVLSRTKQTPKALERMIPVYRIVGNYLVRDRDIIARVF